jgi:DNA-binding MarR family transcriptional regulator
MASRLREELRQTKPFASSRLEAVVGVLRTAAMLEHALGETLRPFGITHTQYNALRILRGAGASGLCGRDVGERLIAKVPDVPRLLDRLEETGLVERRRGTEDRRHVTARITAQGRRVLGEADVALAELDRRRFHALDGGDLEALMRALDALRAAL